MKKTYDELIKIFKSLYSTNFFSIFLSTIFSKMITFVGGVIIVRVLSQNDYGIYSYVMNIISLLSIFGDFGSSSAALQLLVENKDKSNKFYAYLKYGIKVAFCSGIISTILIFLSPIYYPYNIFEAKKFVMILCLVPIITFTINFIPVILRSKFENKLYSIYSFSMTFIHYLIAVPFCLFGGLFGSLISEYVSNVLICLFGLFLLYKNKIINYKSLKNAKCNKRDKKSFLKLSFGFQINNMMVNVLLVLDVFMIGLFISEPNTIAIYKVATVIPQALTFIPASFALYILPHLIQKNKDKKWIKNIFNLIYKYSIIGYSAIVLCLILLSKNIILLIYGKQYLESVAYFNVLLVGFVFASALKMPTVNYFYSIRKMKLINILNIISVVLNIVLNLILYFIFGMIGVAIATTLVNVIISIITVILFYKEMKKDE